MVAPDVGMGSDTWQGSDVDVARIEAALVGLWRNTRAEGGKPEAGGSPSVRTSVINLVVYVSSEGNATAALEAIGALADRHPSRTIVVVADPTAPASSLDASVAAQCSEASAAAGRLCWEQITIKAHGATARHAPGVVIPLLLPDLPTYLWWTGDPPFGDEFFRRMVDLCDRLIVDSQSFGNPIDGVAKLEAMSRRSRDHGVSDFHWIRLTPWRNLLAQFYDKEEFRPYAYRIETVTLGYAHERDGQGLAQALLLAGWIASRLGWTPRPQGARRQGDTLHLEAERQGAVVSITVEPRPLEGCEEGDLVSAHVTATLRDVPAEFVVERHGRDSEATTRARIGGAAGVDHRVRMATRSRGELLAEELEVFRHDMVYEAALEAAVAMCRRLATETRP